MNKTIKLNVQRAIAKEFGVKSNQIILLESNGNIESFKQYTGLNLPIKIASETFAFVIKTSVYIVLGYSATISCLKFEDGDKRYTVESHTIERVPQYEKYYKN